MRRTENRKHENELDDLGACKPALGEAHRLVTGEASDGLCQPAKLSRDDLAVAWIKQQRLFLVGKRLGGFALAAKQNAANIISLGRPMSKVDGCFRVGECPILVTHARIEQAAIDISLREVRISRDG